MSRVKRLVKRGAPTRAKRPTGHEEKKEPTPSIFRKKKSPDTEGTVFYLLSGRRVII